MTEETAKDIRERGARLAVLCRDCGRLRYLGRGVGDNETPAMLQQRLSCHRCGSREVEIRILSRDPVTGFWPAEHG
ncbi:hypothetical protein H2509_14390 [Stappia sp. F7233]|uniref:Uncharacterized protein n=1 Tax=Stappia albiluteola TaxID=2758565 RepID=A0A839AGP5_9HYPH|nr:hypothetical protein [Stappia albiluteola]MBA5778315.1 hypothetical protein [Stappia albiluteola]